MTIIDRLTKDEIKSGKLPVAELLENSFYYPASGFDGGIIKYYSSHIQSFVYCDYAIGEGELISQLDTFYGYHLLEHRSVQKEELIPLGWQMELPPHFNNVQYDKYKFELNEPFAHWAIYERLEEFNDAHGAKKFSLLYIGGEAVATYQALYWANKKTSKALAIIQPGTGFGLNWTDFRKKDGALAWVIMENKYGTPDTIFYGGYGNAYDNFDWKEYQFEKKIQPYYNGKNAINERPSGTVTVWKRISPWTTNPE